MSAAGLLIAAAVLLAAGALLLLLIGRRPERMDQEELRARALGAEGLRERRIATPGADAGDPLRRFLAARLLRAGLEVSPGALGRGLALAAAVLLIAVLVLGFAVSLVLAASAVLAGFGWLAHRQARRHAELIQQLPDFLEHLGRSLGAGNSLEDGLAEATAESPEPIRSLFGSVSRQVRLGAPVDDVLYESAALHAFSELRVMAMAARVNRRYGGSLKRIFRSLIQAIRERDAAGRELRALTAETRFSALTLAVVPIVLMLYILVQNPAYYGEMWALPAGRSLLLGCLLLQAAGVAVIWRMLQAAEEGQT